jgi:hypothetical protein
VPSSITHAYFSLDIYDELDEKIKLNLSVYKEYLKTYAQGPDLLYFYRFLSSSFFHPNKIVRLGHLAHKSKTKAFFINLITYIKEHHLEHNYEVISYLYGSISHYVLDTTVHPLIFYKTGVYNPKRKKESSKYFSLHHDMETYIDAYFIYIRERIQPKDFKTYKFCFNVKKMSKDLIDTINYTYEKTYGVSNVGDIQLKSIRDTRHFFHLIRYDKFGIKKLLYRFIDFIIPYLVIKKSYMSYHIDAKRKIHYLNLDKREWNDPTNKAEYYDYSFIELYSIALKKASNIIKEVNKVLYENKDIKLLDDIFMNLSYITGKDCNLKLKPKYFEY